MLTKTNITSEVNSMKEYLKQEASAQEEEEEEEEEKHLENLKICTVLFMAKGLDIHLKCVSKLRKASKKPKKKIGHQANKKLSIM